MLVENDHNFIIAKMFLTYTVIIDKSLTTQKKIVSCVKDEVLNFIKLKTNNIKLLIFQVGKTLNPADLTSLKAWKVLRSNFGKSEIMHKNNSQVRNFSHFFVSISYFFFTKVFPCIFLELIHTAACGFMISSLLKNESCKKFSNNLWSVVKGKNTNIILFDTCNKK